MTTYLLPQTTVGLYRRGAYVLQRIFVDVPTTDAAPEHHVVAGEAITLDGAVAVEPPFDAELVPSILLWVVDGLVRDSDPHTVLHASCVALDGRGVLLPGSSGSGKSNVAAAAVTAGWSYLCDEFAIVDPRTGLLVAYCKPIDLDAASRERFGVDGDLDLVPASTLRGGASVDGAAPAAVAFPRYSGDGVPEQLVAIDALVALLTNATALDRDRFLHLAAIARACPVWTLPFDDARAAAAALDGYLGDAQPVRPAAAEEPVVPGTVTVWFDEAAVVFDEETTHIHVLNEAAAAMWLDDPDALRRQNPNWV
jgi:hypothetical protein